MPQSEFNPAPVTAKAGQVWRTKAGGLFVIPEGINPLNFDLVEMVRDEHGFTIWRGGEQPKEIQGSRVSVKLREHPDHEFCVSPAEHLCWSHTGGPGEIVAYKVVDEAKASLTGSPDGADALAYGISQSDIAAIDKSFAQFAGADLGAEGGDRHVISVEIPRGYDKLFGVLVRAFEQASAGKGKERHASDGISFEDQPISAINRTLGSVDGFLYQAGKKAAESRRLPPGRAQAELLGAINYLAGAVIACDTWYEKNLPKP